MIQVRLQRSASQAIGNAEAGVEEREGEPAEQAHLRVVDAELFLDRRGEDADDLPVDEVEGVDDEQEPQHEIAVGVGGWGGGVGRALLRHVRRKESGGARESRAAVSLEEG